jgi:hypothetical protein
LVADRVWIVSFFFLQQDSAVLAAMRQASEAQQSAAGERAAAVAQIAALESSVRSANARLQQAQLDADRVLADTRTAYELRLSEADSVRASGMLLSHGF